MYEHLVCICLQSSESVVLHDCMLITCSTGNSQRLWTICTNERAPLASCSASYQLSLVTQPWISILENRHRGTSMQSSCSYVAGSSSSLYPISCTTF